MKTRESSFVNKQYNNKYYEWGRNCATLEFNQTTASRCLNSFENFLPEDSDMFWEGYNDGPRNTKEVYSIYP